MEKVPRNGVDWRSEDGEENRDLVTMTGCAPIECGTEGLTIDVKVAPTLDEWEASMVDKVDVSSKLKGVLSIVKTITFIDAQ